MLHKEIKEKKFESIRLQSPANPILADIHAKLLNDFTEKNSLSDDKKVEKYIQKKMHSIDLDVSSNDFFEHALLQKAKCLPLPDEINDDLIFYHVLSGDPVPSAYHYPILGLLLGLPEDSKQDKQVKILSQKFIENLQFFNKKFCHEKNVFYQDKWQPMYILHRGYTMEFFITNPIFTAIYLIENGGVFSNPQQLLEACQQLVNELQSFKGLKRSVHSRLLKEITEKLESIIAIIPLKSNESASFSIDPSPIAFLENIKYKAIRLNPLKENPLIDSIHQELLMEFNNKKFEDLEEVEDYFHQSLSSVSSNFDWKYFFSHIIFQATKCLPLTREMNDQLVLSLADDGEVGQCIVKYPFLSMSLGIADELFCKRHPDKPITVIDSIYSKQIQQLDLNFQKNASLLNSTLLNKKIWYQCFTPNRQYSYILQRDYALGFYATNAFFTAQRLITYKEKNVLPASSFLSDACEQLIAELNQLKGLKKGISSENLTEMIEKLNGIVIEEAIKQVIEQPLVEPIKKPTVTDFPGFYARPRIEMPISDNLDEDQDLSQSGLCKIL